MFRVMKWWMIPLLAFALALSINATAKAQETNKETGGVLGTVLDKDGKAASGVQVRLFKPFERGGRKTARADAQNADPAAGAKPGKGDKAARGDRPKPVATATTDTDGKFSMSDVPVGKYVVLAVLRGQGMARQDVEVTAGGTANVDLKLSERRAKGGDKKSGKKGVAPAAE